MTALSPLHRDAIGEILNIAIGRAGSALSELVGEEVSLAAPEIEFVHHARLADVIDGHTRDRASAVRQTFDGPFAGDALLIFPETKSLELVRSIIGEEVEAATMSDLEQDALLEVGNIILNACLGTLADLLGQEIRASLPSYRVGRGREILGVTPDGTGPSEADIALFMEVDFALKSRNVSGYVAFVLDIASTERFTRLVDGYLEAELG